MVPDSVITILPMAALFGLSAGLSPGPLLTLVISETIQRNWMAGIRVALSPLITDLPIILATWFVFNKLSGFSLILGIISVAGGTYFTWLGFETFKSNNIQTEGSGPESESLRRGIIANFLIQILISSGLLPAYLLHIRLLKKVYLSSCYISWFFT